MPLLTGEPVAGAGAQTTSTVLDGVVVSFSGALEASASRRQALKRLVTTHGGRIAYILSKQVTHLVVGEEDVDELLRQQQQDHLVDSRVRKAQELGLQVVSDRWLLDSAAARTLLDDIPYSFSWKQRMLLQGLSVNTRPEEYCLSRLVAGMRDVRLLSKAVGFDDAVKGRTSARSQQLLAARPHHGSNEPSWAVSLRAKREQLLTERRLDKERKRREEKERKRQEAERLRQKEREGQQDWKRYRAQRSQERRDDQRVKKLERLEANWSEERVRIEARAREKRKGKVIRMLLWEKRKIDERTKELRDIKRAQDTKEARLALWEEWERKKSVWRRQEAFESGRKIFVGGFKFDDVADEGESKARFIVEKRKEHLRALFASFGPILAVREQWAKEFVFVLYKEPEDAARAFETIRDSEKRRSMVEFIKRGLVENGEPSVYAPSPSFYVRWPRQKYEGRRGGVRSPEGAQTKANDDQLLQQKQKEEEEAKRKEEAKEKKKLEKRERKKWEREERKEKRKSEKRAVVEQMKARGQKTTPAAIGRQMKKMKKNEGGGKPQKTKTTEPTSDRTKKASDSKPKSQTKKNEDDAGAKQERATKKTKQTKKASEGNPHNKAPEKKGTKQPAPTQAPTTALERRERRERELAELRAKSLEELEDALDVLQAGRRELIRGWRRGWETPEETRRWHRLMFEKEKKRRRLQREAERLQRKRDKLDQRRLARFEARKRERLEKRERELDEARQWMAEVGLRSQRIKEASERERQRKRDEELEAKRLRNERERAQVAFEIAQMRAALRLQKNRRRRARKRHEAAIKEDEARLADLRLRQEEERRGGARKPSTTIVVAASSAHHLLKSRAGRQRKDDSWIVAGFALLCVLVFVCALCWV